MIKMLFRWFMANALLPILAPVVFMCIIYWFLDGRSHFLQCP